MNKERLEDAFPRLSEIPFQSEKQYMATLHAVEGRRLAYVKGSPERLLAMSTRLLYGDGARDITEEDRNAVLEANAGLAAEAMRVMATAYVECACDHSEILEEHLLGGLVFVGLSGMSDPPRPEAIEAVDQCKKAGIRVVMITGDNRITARSVADKLGLAKGETVTGDQLTGMTDETLAGHIKSVSVFARIEPLHKLRIVQAFRAGGQVVAMNGDGVNDAPALKAANIGIVMGKMGTDVAKEASDVVLADDNFATIVAAVEEGRAIFGRLRNVTFFLLTTCFGELLALILSVLILGKAPLLAIHVLWVNLVTGTIMSIPLGLESKIGDELHHRPRDPRVGLLFPGMLYRVGFLAGALGIAVFLVFRWASQHMPLEEARTIAFTTMVTFEWFVVFNARSDEHSAFKLGFLSNRPLVWALLLAVCLQIGVVYLSPLQLVFKTVPLGLGAWMVVVAAGTGVFLIETVRKIAVPRLFSRGKWLPSGKGS